MKTESQSTLFRVLVVVAALSYMLHWFLPYSYGFLGEDVGSLLLYGGYGAIYEGNAFIDRAIFGAWIVCAIGLFLYRRVARTAYLVLVVVGTAAIPLYGVLVETAGGAMLLAIAQISDGAILAISYFSPLRERFH